MVQFIIIIFISIVSISTIFLLCILILLCFRRKLRPDYQTRSIESSFPNSNTSNQTPTTENASFDPSLNQISMSELISATNNFDRNRIIGDGGFGLVYKAELNSGVEVAVKKLSPDAFQGIREFRAEMETLGKLRHPNIVKILGYCVSGQDRILIYEFIERGSLDEWLYETTSFRLPLSWEMRVTIVKGVANGLGYLHGLDRPIVHRDIKSSNILLDLGFKAHIADFGLARTIEGVDSHKSTQAAGTLGYMPPEYKAGVTAAKVEGDVYSFGVVMLEVVTGRRASWPIKNDGPNGNDVWLVDWVRKMVTEGKEMEALDGSVDWSGLKVGDVALFFEIANLCTLENPSERPPIGKVIDMLNQITT